MSAAEPIPHLDAAIAFAKRWGRRLLVLVVVVAAILALLNVYVNIETTHLWFDSVRAGHVYSTILRTEILLFVVFGVVAAVLGGVAAFVALRMKPLPAHPRDVDADDDEIADWRLWLQDHQKLTRRLVLAFGILVPGIKLGARASHQWQKWQLWRHVTPWGVKDPTFHRDISYYVQVYPFHRMVVTLLTSAVVWAFWLTVLAALQRGTLRLRGPQRITKPLVAQLSLIGALYLVLRAGGYWLDRSALVTSRRASVTGVSYTDLHATAPGRIVLVVAALVIAVLLLVNVVLRRKRVVAFAVAVMVVVSFLAGSLWPSLLYKLREQPSASSLELGQIANNQKATLAAFGLKFGSSGNVSTSTYGTKLLHGSDLQKQADQGAQVRILDPNQLSPTFNVKQQLQAYYGFKSTLDIDRYPIDGTSRDVAIAPRELNVSNIPLGSWANKHLVYTHGTGIVAAPTDSISTKSDVPEFLDGGLPPGQQIPVTRPQIYFGQSSPSYSIVGEPKGSTKNVEFDSPGAGGAKAQHTTYDGDGGVPIGSTWRRLLYAAKLGSPNILFSKGVNSGSRILTVRNPRARVAQVAPWLTLDGDTYAAVVDGHIEWIVDGYTTTNNYPDSQLVNLRQATTSTLTQNGSSIAQGNQAVNYMQNSVKAVVDAYTGDVTLYEWNQSAQPDPLLKAWESVFPGLVKPQSDMPTDLVSHLRYPQDLFDVQRQLLTKYHVTGAADFYSGSGFWAVPSDPTVGANAQLNAGGGGASSGPTQPSTYMSISADGYGPASFSLSSPLVTLNRQDLAAFLTVDSEPGPDYGKFTLLQFPSGELSPSPSQVQNDVESNTEISEALTLERGGNSKVVVGNLLSFPVGGQMLYVEPIYTQASAGGSFPILRHVVAIYGDGDPAFTSDLPQAVQEALASGDRADTADSQSPNGGKGAPTR